MNDIIGAIPKYHKISHAKEYLALDVFNSVSASRELPASSQTFYIRAKNTVYEPNRDDNTNIINGITQRAFIPWNRNQLWCFIRTKDNQGLLIHPESSHYLIIKNNKLELEFSHNYSYEDGIFEYNPNTGEWKHLQTGYRLSYITGCGGGPNHDPISVNYNFDIVPAADVMNALINSHVCWSNTNTSESCN
jgi:hypothetical protein